MKLRICRLWAVLVTSLGFPQLPLDIPVPPNPSPSAIVARLQIPIKLYRDYLVVVQGSLGTVERLNFLVDTGANPSAVDRRIATKLLLRGEADELALLNGSTKVERVVLPTLQLGPIRAESLPGVIQDLYPVEKVLGVRIDAIIGFDVLSRGSFSIDYSSKKMDFGPIAPSPLAVPFDTGPPSFTVHMQIRDEPVRLLVDTGTPDLLLFECKLRGRLRQLSVLAVSRSLNGAGMQLEAGEVWLPKVRFGVTDFGLQKGFLVSDDANCNRSFDGVVGAKSLGLKWIAFDFEHQRFRWKR